MEKLRAKDELVILLVEQNTRVVLDFSQRTVVLDRGRVVYDGDSRTLRDDEQLLVSLIGVTG
ncbi:MAG TPA: hypothetical protein QGG32_08990 [Rhodospirillales bacterium]|jgi:branched-chain amino acid transport system ATP-binding protein|nr:hypothetical protein [Rhodospirillales bacterium]